MRHLILPLFLAAAVRGAEPDLFPELDPRAALAAAAAVSVASHPNADTVLVDDLQTVRYEASGAARTHDDIFTKILTERGRREEAVLSLPFYANYGTAEVTRIELHKPDGRVVPVDLAAQSRVMVARDQMDSNIYDPNHKVLQISIPGLETGDVLRTTIRRTEYRQPMPGVWSDFSIFESTAPILRYAYQVFGPTNRPLVHRVVRDPVPGTMNASSGVTNGLAWHRWEFRNVPRMYEEPNMPDRPMVVQRLLVSTIPDWATISRWYWKLSEPRLRAVTPEMKETARGLVAGATGDLQKVEAVFAFVSQKIRYMGIIAEDEAPGFEPHDVSITFSNRYGVCRDKAALLVALLREAGLPAFPVLIHAGTKKDPEVATPWFNHAVVAVRRPDGSYQLMDPTNEHTKDLFPSYLCDKSYLVATPEGDPLRTSPIVPAEENLVRIETAARVDARGRARGETTLRFDGINDTSYRGAFSRMRPDERRRYFEGAVRAAVPGARLTALELEPADMQDTAQPLRARLAFESDGLFIDGEGLRLFPAPWFGAAVGIVGRVLGATGLETRRYPLATDIACGTRESFTVEFDAPPGAGSRLPAYEPVDTPEVSWRRQLTLDDGRLRGAGEFLIKVVEFPTNRYLVLKDTLRTVERNGRKMAILAADRGPGQADSVVECDDAEIEVTGPGAWTVTRTVARRILTYAGTKAFSELKLDYNPVWEGVDLVEAKVTTADGAVKRVSPKEMNLMDAGWAGAAPRYPAGKTLVASLPGVGVGSLLEYTVRRTYRDQPFFSMLEVFRGFDPVKEKRVSLRLPRTLDVRLLDRGDGAIAAEETRDGDARVWTASAADQPMIRREDSLPPTWAFCPAAGASAGDWGAYAKQLRAALERAAAGQPEAAALGRRLAAGARDPAGRVRAIRDHVAEQIRSAGPSFADLPLSALTPADRTLREGYGHSADRAALLAAMLRGAGIRADFVAVSGLPRVEALARMYLDCPQARTFGSILVRVGGGDGWYLNDTDRYADLGMLGHEGRPALDLARGRVITLRPGRGYESRGESVYDVVLAPDRTATIAVELRTFGAGAAGFRRQFTELPPEERRRYVQERVAQVSTAAKLVGDFVTDLTSYPAVERFTVTVPDFAVRDGAFLYLAAPLPRAGLEGVRAETRENPLYWDDDSRRTVRAAVRLPADSGGARILPPDFEWSPPDTPGRVACRTEVAGDGGTNVVTLVREQDLPACVLDAGAYDSLLQATRDLIHPRMSTIMFEQ